MHQVLYIDIVRVAASLLLITSRLLLLLNKIPHNSITMTTNNSSYYHIFQSHIPHSFTFTFPIPLLSHSTATFPFLTPLMDYIMLNYTSTIEPWKVVHHTALRLIEARRSGTAKPAKVMM